MSTEPMIALLRADRRAAEIRREAYGGGGPIGVPSVLRGAPTHSGAFLLQALEELGWELRPITEGLEPSVALARRLFAAAADLDAVHRSLSVAQILACLEMQEAAGMVVMEGETR